MSSAVSKWRDKYKTLKEYYEKEYNSEYYSFNKHQLEIDPDETLEDLNNYTDEEKFAEFRKCVSDFPYFAQKYIKILNIKDGLVPFILFKYQLRCINEFETKRWNIISKFRQGGLTTLAELWGLWRCIFKRDQQILFISKTDREATAAGEIINRSVQYLPEWLKPSKEGKWNDHIKQFADTDGQIGFFSPEAARGRTATYLIIDEAAFIDKMEEHWKALYPVLSTGGNAIVISTVHGVGNWYEEQYRGAQHNKNKFNIIDIDYWEHPFYNNPTWVEDQKAQLGEKGWKQEVLRSFLDSGNTFIPSGTLVQLQQETRILHPKRKKFPKYVNQGGGIQTEGDWGEVGALWIWKEPIENHDYILGVDASEGLGGENDNSVIEILDANTLEQVGEFYSNNIHLHVFAGIVNQLGIFYNHGLTIVENLGPGAAIVNILQYDLRYDNLYYENLKSNKTGIKITPSNRPVMLEYLQNRIINETLKINSTRLVAELTTFSYNKKSEKPEASHGYHDDAIMAMAFALYVRETLLREVPLIGEAALKENAKVNNSQIYEEIKKEILEGSVRDILDDYKKNQDFLESADDPTIGVVLDIRRKYNSLLKEFGW